MGKNARTDIFPERLVRQGLVSLVIAARMVHRRAYPQQYAIAEPTLTPQQLDALAHVISTFAPIYTVIYRSARFRQLTEADLSGAVFRDGARELAFQDGREPIRYLAARMESTSQVARRLRDITDQNAAGAPTQKDRSPQTPTR